MSCGLISNPNLKSENKTKFKTKKLKYMVVLIEEKF